MVIDGDYNEVPEVKFSELKDVLDDFVTAIIDNNEKEIAYLEEKFMRVVYGFIRFYVRKKYSRDHSARSTLGSTSLTHRVFDYIYLRNRIPTHINNIRENPSAEAVADCLRFTWDAIDKKARFIPIDEYNRKKREEILPTDDEFSAITNREEASSHEKAVENERNEILYEILSEFPEDEQEVINLADLQGLTLRDAAMIIQMEESTFRKKRKRINEKIKIKLKERGVDI